MQNGLEKCHEECQSEGNHRGTVSLAGCIAGPCRFPDRTADRIWKIDGTYFVSKVLHRISSGGEYEQGLSLYRIKGEARTEETPEEVSGGQERDYIVKRGDTLWDLAKAYYGSGTKYTIIYDANHEIIEAEAKNEGVKVPMEGTGFIQGQN